VNRYDEDDDDGGRPVVDRVGSLLIGHSATLAVAESLTGGLLANRFAAASHAGSWFLGGAVTYTREAKQRVLHAGYGSLVSERTALEMARGIRRLYESDLGVAVTGAGGPDGHDGAEPGEVWIALVGPRGEVAACHTFDGDPLEVCRRSCDSAVTLVLNEILGQQFKAFPA
jgi:nicotinamide-nucleotide amidase